MKFAFSALDWDLKLTKVLFKRRPRLAEVFQHLLQTVPMILVDKSFVSSKWQWSLASVTRYMASTAS